MIVDPILLSGPSITHREIENAVSATAVGWNRQKAAYVEQLEKRMAALTGLPFALAVASGSMALRLAVLAMHLHKGDEVLVPEIAPMAVASAVRLCGATPVFCDVEEASLCLSPASAEKRITARTKGIIAVHPYGHRCDMPVLKNFRKNTPFFC